MYRHQLRRSSDINLVHTGRQSPVRSGELVYGLRGCHDFVHTSKGCHPCSDIDRLPIDISTIGNDRTGVKADTNRQRYIQMGSLA